MTPDVAINEFLRLFAQDREAGTQRSLKEYQAMWPQFRDQVAAEFAQLAESTAGEPEVGGGSASAWRWIDHYEVRGVIGRGGQAVVLDAWDTAFHRPVAIKILTGLGLLTPRARLRLEREARLLARLNHPGLCGVVDAGEHDGQPYLVMHKVAGSTLAQLIEASRAREDGDATENADPESSASLPETRDLVRIFAAVARALHHAHESGIVHRDVKPGNIMVTPSGAPVVLDFGLARGEEVSTVTMTRTGDFHGTPSYMSPEQLTGGAESITPASDVYSLGVCLFECLTRRRPFEQAQLEALYEAIRRRPAPDLRRQRGIPRDLAIIVGTALEKNRHRRYATAADFAVDLERFAKRRPILARRPNMISRVGQWARRNPSVATLGCVLLVTIVAAGSWAAHSLRVIDGKRQEAELRGDIMRRQAYRADVAAAMARIQQGDAQGGLRFLDSATPELRGWEWQHARFLADRSEMVLRTHTGSGNFQVLQDMPNTLLTWGEDAENQAWTVRFWDLRDGTCTRELTGLPSGMYLPDARGERLLVISTKRRTSRLRLWSVAEGRSLWEFDAKDIRTGPGGRRWSPDQSRIAIGIPQGILVVDAKDGRQRLLPLEGTARGPHYLDDRRILTMLETGSQSQVVIIDETTGTVERVLAAPYPGARAAKAAPHVDPRYIKISWRRPVDGQMQIRGSWFGPGTIQVVDSQDGKVLWSRDDLSLGFEWLPAAGAAVLVRFDGDLEVVDVQSGEPLARLRGHRNAPRRVTLSQDGRQLYSGTSEGELRVWSTEFHSHPFSAQSWGSQKAVVAPDGTWVANGKWGTVTRFDTDSGEPAWRVHTGRGVVTAMAIAADSESLVVGYDTGEVHFLSPAGKILRKAEFEGSITALGFAAEGKQLAAGTSHGTLFIGSAHTDFWQQLLPAQEPIRLLAWTGSGDHCWLCTSDQLIVVNTGSGLSVDARIELAATALSRGAQAGTMVTGDRSGVIRLHDARSGTMRRELGRVGSAALSMAQVDRGRRLAIGTAQSFFLLNSETGDAVFDHPCASLFLADIGFRQDSGAIILAGRRRAFDALETRAPNCGARYRRRVREALGWIEALYREEPLAASVLQALDRSAARSDPRRELARAIVGRLADPANELNGLAWSIVSSPGAETKDYERAVEFARRAAEIEPDSYNILNTLGIALYRAGQWAEAEVTLAKCRDSSRERTLDSLAIDAAAWAMAVAKQGRLKAARAALLEAESAARRVEHLDGETEAFLREAREVVGPAN